jgi:hypothetical protein
MSFHVHSAPRPPLSRSRTRSAATGVMSGLSGCLLGTLFVATFFSMGCASSKPPPKPRPVAWNLEITKTVPAAIEIDLIPINTFNRAAWEEYDLDRYWRPNDRRRAEQRNKVSKELEENEPVVIDRSAEIWETWLHEDKAVELLLIANLPGSDFPSGLADPRRVFLPLDRRHWAAEKHKLEIEVRSTEVLIRTSPRR